jgi:hypothetical protein
MEDELYHTVSRGLNLELEAGTNPRTVALACQKLCAMFEEKDSEFDRDEFRAFCGLAEFRWVQNLMSRAWVLEHKDTPWCCSVGSETYWSM